MIKCEDNKAAKCVTTAGLEVCEVSKKLDSCGPSLDLVISRAGPSQSGALGEISGSAPHAVF